MIICCNYFYINVKWPLTCILIGIKAHLLEDKQISSVRVFDKDLFDTLLDPKSWFYDQILPQIVPFVFLGTWNVITKKWSILELFERFYAQEWRKQENQQKSLELHWKASGITSWRRHVILELMDFHVLDALWRPGENNTWRCQVLKSGGRLVLG
jgi:hypothetical protein